MDWLRAYQSGSEPRPTELCCAETPRRQYGTSAALGQSVVVYSWDPGIGVRRSLGVSDSCLGVGSLESTVLELRACLVNSMSPDSAALYGAVAQLVAFEVHGFDLGNRQDELHGCLGILHDCEKFLQ